MAVFVGCDLGTTMSKAGVVAADGTMLGSAFEEVELIRRGPGWAEQDMLGIEASAHRVIRGALEAAGWPTDVAGVAVSGQMSGIGAVGDRYEPVAPYDSWLDSRCAPYVEALTTQADRVIRLSGCPPTYSHGPKMLWWRHERPADYARIRKFVPIGSFVAGRLAGLAVDDAFTDRSYLHFTNAADTRAGTWSDDLIALLDLDPDRLPRLVDPTDLIGAVTSAAAEATGLPRGTPIAAGAGDTAAAALGAAVVRPGRAFDVAGTASVLAVCLDTFRPDTEARTILAARGVVPGTFVNMAFVNGGGLALRWFRDELWRGADDRHGYGALDAAAEQVEPGSGGLLWFPHLQGQVLPPHPEARGAWVGLSSSHGSGHLYRAILEGIAFEYARWMSLIAVGEPLPITETRALGGGAASRLWNQIKADVTGVSWAPVRFGECGVLGDALIAAAATGSVDDLAATAERWQEIGTVVRPDPARATTYGRLKPAYRALADSLGPVFREIRAGHAADGGFA